MSNPARLVISEQRCSGSELAASLGQGQLALPGVSALALVRRRGEFLGQVQGIGWVAAEVAAVEHFGVCNRRVRCVSGTAPHTNPGSSPERT